MVLPLSNADLNTYLEAIRLSLRLVHFANSRFFADGLRKSPEATTGKTTVLPGSSLGPRTATLSLRFAPRFSHTAVSDRGLRWIYCARKRYTRR